ncbi:hypothetical protein lerEdw1_006569 [Lerista edwardsae]|nr:hypothetical protein lerEdw1_006569 [Lerista edwardsae]
MDLLIGTVLFTVLSFSLCVAPARITTSELKVTNGGQWGVWGLAKFCRKGRAYGFQIKVLPYQGEYKDDTGLEGVRLICTDGSTVESSSAGLGDWSDVQMCPKGSLISFALRVTKPQGLIIDETAANNIKFKCGDGNILTGVGHEWGEFGEWSPACSRGTICGIQTKVEPDQGGTDDNTGLNDVKFFCCSWEQSRSVQFYLQSGSRYICVSENQDRLPSMDLLIGTVLFTVLSCGLCGVPARIITFELRVNNGGPWGVWGPPEYCPRGRAYGFQIKGMIILIHLLDRRGTWSNIQTCPRRTLISFALRVSGNQGLGDDTAANNVAFKCADDTVLEGAGHEWGRWAWSPACSSGTICGIQTRVEPDLGYGPSCLQFQGYPEQERNSIKKTHYYLKIGGKNQDWLPSMDLLNGTVVFMVLSFGLRDAPARIRTSNLTVKNGSCWDVWGPAEICQSGHANGFSIKVKGSLNHIFSENLDRLPSMDLFIGIVLFTVLSFGLCGVPDRIVTSHLTVKNGGQWGVWGPPEYCHSGHANGFSIKGMIILILFLDRRGTWSDVQTCPKGNLRSFALRVAKPLGLKSDDTAANNIEFKCADDNVLTGAGHEWGEFGEWSPACSRGTICGIQTKVEPDQHLGDNTGLNDVKLLCCL